MVLCIVHIVLHMIQPQQYLCVYVYICWVDMTLVRRVTHCPVMVAQLPSYLHTPLFISTPYCMVSPRQNKIGLINGQNVTYGRNLVMTSAGFSLPDTWQNLIMPDATAALTLWKDSAVWRLSITDCGIVDDVTTLWLSPNIQDGPSMGPSMGTPMLRNVMRRSMICSVAMRAATNSEPYVLVSTVPWRLENQSTGVWLTKCRMPVADLPVTLQCCRFASTKVVVRTTCPLAQGP